ncbi:MAG: flagellar export chaperone FliS [Pseudomonadota bacterium]
MNKKLKGYTQGSLRARVAGADPYQLIQMLMAGALDNLNYAKGAIERKDLENKAVHISKASNIIESLRSSLNSKVGGEVAGNLEQLYLYMNEVLADASRNNDVDKVSEVQSLLSQIKSSWDAIPMSARQEAESQMSNSTAVGA